MFGVNNANCGLIVDFSLNLGTYAIFPIDAVLVNNISPSCTFISGDSSYLSKDIYVLFSNFRCPSSSISAGLKVIAPSPSDTKSVLL